MAADLPEPSLSFWQEYRSIWSQRRETICYISASRSSRQYDRTCFRQLDAYRPGRTSALLLMLLAIRFGFVPVGVALTVVHERLKTPSVCKGNTLGGGCLAASALSAVVARAGRGDRLALFIREGDRRSAGCDWFGVDTHIVA